MATFTIKASDTRPILEVALKNPDGSAHDLTGATTFTLRIKVSPTTVFSRDMVKQGLDTAGVLRYTWAASDWAAGTPPYLPVPTVPYQSLELEMEYEVTGGSSRMTFPNDTYDILEIYGDIA